MKKLSLVFIILLCIFFMLTACGKKNERADVKLMYWSASPEAEIQMQNWLAEYSQLFKKKVEDIPTPFGSYNQKLLILLGAQSAPDLFLLTPELLTILKEKDGLLALDDYFKRDGLLFPDTKLYPNIYGADQKLYAIPVGEDSYAIFARANNPEESWNLLKFLRQQADHL